MMTTKKKPAGLGGGAAGLADPLLNRLEAVKRTGNGTWLARCPAHQDKRPSLSIREQDDRVLVHCFAGCACYDVLAAVGLEFSDLYPPRAIDHSVKPLRRPFPAADVLEAIGHESLIIALSAAQIARGEPLSETDRARLMTATERLQNAGSINE